MTCYLDTSVLVPTLIVEATTKAVGQFLLAHSGELTVSAFAAIELASAISRLVRMDRLTMAQGVDLLADFDEWRTGAAHDCDVTASDFHLANSFVRRFDLRLRAPDALHAAVCRRLQFELVTLDNRLAIAARELGIAVVVPT